MIFIFIILSIGAVFGGHIAFQIVPLSFATLYGLAMAPGAFTGGFELDREKLVNIINEKWFDSEEIAKFIQKYWCSIKFAMSAQQRGGNLSFIGMASFLLAGYFYYKNMQLWVIVWSIINGFFLWPIGNKVNKALFLLRYFPKSNEAKIACVSFIALSEILQNENFQFIVSNVLPKEQVQDAIDTYCKVPTEYNES
jgi:hypothetical protein